LVLLCGNTKFFLLFFFPKYQTTFSFFSARKSVRLEKDDLAVSFDSYTLQQPSREFIEALTDVSVSITHHQAFQEAKMKYPKLIILDLMLAEYYAMWLEKRLFQFHTTTATERYKDILNRSPYIVQTIPLTIIASYLGISLETLSRIRAKI